MAKGRPPRPDLRREYQPKVRLSAAEYDDLISEARRRRIPISHVMRGRLFPGVSKIQPE